MRRMTYMIMAVLILALAAAVPVMAAVSFGVTIVGDGIALSYGNPPYDAPYYGYRYSYPYAYPYTYGYPYGYRYPYSYGYPSISFSYGNFGGYRDYYGGYHGRGYRGWRGR